MCGARFLYTVFIRLLLRTPVAKISFQMKASNEERLLIVPFLGLYQTSHFQLVGPNLMSSPFEPCQGVWFWLALGALGAEMDEYSNDSCPGPHSHQHICGEDEEG